jgi:CheY-like chemotaxis protein
MRIVFCEDEPTIRKLIELSMRGTAHEFRIAADGSEALDLVRRWRPEALVTDIAMPGMDGIQLVEAVRDDPGLPDLRIVFMTASSLSAGAEETAAHQGISYLRKPFGPSALRRLLDAIAQGRPAAPGASPSSADR